MLNREDSIAKIEVWNAPEEISVAIIRECLLKFHQVRLRTKGSCMGPEIAPGMPVIVSQPGLRPPRMGDVILLRHPAGLKLHRLLWGPPLASRWSRWRTRADQGLAWDPWITAEGVVGTVVCVEGVPGQGGRLRGWGLIRLMLVGLLRGLSA